MIDAQNLNYLPLDSVRDKVLLGGEYEFSRAGPPSWAAAMGHRREALGGRAKRPNQPLGGSGILLREVVLNPFEIREGGC